MIDSVSFFTLFYALFCLGFVFQSREFIGAGLSPEQIFSTWIPTEDIQFIEHHMLKNSFTLILHSALPWIYLFIYAFISTEDPLIIQDHFAYISQNKIFYSIFVFSLILILTTAAWVQIWATNSWNYHPFAQKLKLQTVNNSWREVMQDINREFRRIDKLIIQTSPLTKIVITDNWIILIGQWPWEFQVAQKSNVTLELIQSVHLALSPDADEAGGIQYLSVKVNCSKSQNSFVIRMKSTEYRELENRTRGNIANVQNIAIYKSVSERFIEVFREHVEQNPKFSRENAEIENCIGCMAVPADVKLIRRCDTNSGENPCQTCYCLPMWCCTCLGKWFAMRQDQDRPDTWLASKCPCPTCRNKFCLLDVSIIEN